MMLLDALTMATPLPPQDCAYAYKRLPKPKKNNETSKGSFDPLLLIQNPMTTSMAIPPSWNPMLAHPAYTGLNPSSVYTYKKQTS